MKEKNVLTLTCVMIVFLFIFTAPASLFSHPDEESKTKESRIKKLSDMTLDELMNVKITTAGKTPERIGDIPASVVLITREDIEIYGYRTLTEILENIPGLFSIDDYGEEGANFGVRGFWSGVPNDNMIILVNGVSLVSDIQSNYPLTKIAVPVEAIDRIEVIRGPMSVFYGNGAFYGVINIITNDVSHKAVSLVSTSVGSQKTGKVFLRLADEIKDFHYILNASFYDTYGLDHELSKMTNDPSGLTPQTNTTGGKLENTEKYFNFSGTFKDFYLNLSYNESKKEFYFAFPSLSDGTYINNNRIDLSLGYRKELSKTVTIDGKFSYSHNRDWIRYHMLFENFFGIQQLETQAWEAELDAFIKPSPDFEITVGGYYRSILNATNIFDIPSFGTPTLENNYIYLFEDDIVTRALFTQFHYNPFKKLRLVAGVRLEQSPRYKLGQIRTEGAETTLKLDGVYNRDNIEIIPRFAAIYYLNDHHIFKFLFGKAINRPSFDQNRQNSLDPEHGDLEPESIQTFELNYISSISPKFTLYFNVFRNTLNRLITRIVELDAEGNYTTYSGNAEGKMVTNGMELTLNSEPFENFRVELSGTYQKTEDKRVGFKNITAAYSPKFLGYLKASYRADTFTLGLTGNYVGAMETFWDETIDARIGDKVEDYFMLSANLRIKDLIIDGLYLNIKCFNLLNEEIRYPTFTNNQWLDKGTIGMGRTFLVTLGYKF